MNTKLFKTVFILWFIVSVFLNFNICYSQAPQKKIYMTYLLQGNMNYDRYVKSTIWRDFPVIYENLLKFMDEHPDFKGQIYLSGQTFLSLKQTAPYVIEHARKLHERGQINFASAFYSEPVNVSIDGETNFRCAQLGTSIIANGIGSTDGFDLQERAYHPQLPWILNNAGVSWVPVITGDDSTFPFKLRGMDGSVTTCVPISSDEFTDIFNKVPDKSLLLVENDFEIPQVFADMYERVNNYLKENKDIDIEWITVKEYIEKFGVKEEKYIDHTANAKNINNETYSRGTADPLDFRQDYTNGGTYSRWTADPLDIIVQDYTNHAMSDFRAATIVNSLTQYLFNRKIDEPFNGSKITLKHDPLIWDIEQAGMYPDVEPKYLSKEGQVTIMSKMEHLLLWAVNSDARGWYPLYERRRERINSLENSSALSKEIINRGLDVIAQGIKANGYDKYFILFNAEPQRDKIITIETSQPYDIYDYNGVKLNSTIISTGDKYVIDFESSLPAYGYKVIGLKKSNDVKEYNWTDGNSIENPTIKVTALDDKIIFNRKGIAIELSLDSFKLKALAEMVDGIGDEKLRDAVPYGKSRISIRKTLYPQLRIEKQIDWLVHMQQTFTLLPDRILCENTFTFPHPTILRKQVIPSFNPEGLNLRFTTKEPGEVFYDIPFGISPHRLKNLSYFCSLSLGILQFTSGGGYMITTGTGEQAFFTNPGEGTIGLYLGSSTTSGPIRNVGMKFVTETQVDHEPAWYAEPFHGTYTHKFMLFPYDGNWQENHAPSVSKSYTEEVYLREFFPVKNSGDLSPEKSLISLSQPGIEITSIEPKGNELLIRLNDKEKKDSEVNLKIGNKTKNVHIQANGIINVKF
jgi:hypothetical protein